MIKRIQIIAPKVAIGIIIGSKKSNLPAGCAMWEVK